MRVSQKVQAFDAYVGKLVALFSHKYVHAIYKGVILDLWDSTCKFWIIFSVMKHLLQFNWDVHRQMIRI